MIHIKNKKWQTFKTILIIFLIIFTINHYNIKNGYKEKLISEKTIITEKNKEEFEQDIKSNKYIDIKKYNNKDNINTNNTLGKIGYKTSETINKIVTKGTKEIYEILKKLFS